MVREVLGWSLVTFIQLEKAFWLYIMCELKYGQTWNMYTPASKTH